MSIASPKKTNIVFSSARRYLRFGNPVMRKQAATEWTLKKAGIKDQQNSQQALQKFWLDSLNAKEPNFFDQIITLYFAYLDISNYQVDVLIEQMFDEQMLAKFRPMSTEQDDEYFAKLIKDNGFSNEFFKDARLDCFSAAERFYFALAMSHPLPWSCLVSELKIADSFQTKPKRFMRLINLVDYLCLKFEKPKLKELNSFVQVFDELSIVSHNSRKSLGTPLPEKKIVLVEGNTELLALPHLAKCLAYDFNELGITLIAVGGKNQILKQYKTWSRDTKLPIAMLLDADAIEQIDELNTILRDQDQLFVIEEGEFEDCFELDIVVDLCNQILLAGQPQLSVDEFDLKQRRTLELNRIWRLRGMGDFDKVAFANSIIDYIEAPEQIPTSLERVISLLTQAS